MNVKSAPRALTRPAFLLIGALVAIVVIGIAAYRMQQVRQQGLEEQVRDEMWRTGILLTDDAGAFGQVLDSARDRLAELGHSNSIADVLAALQELRTQADYLVAPDKKADFTTIQAALAHVKRVDGLLAASQAEATPFTLVISPGTYREAPSMIALRSPLTIVGAGEGPVVLQAPEGAEHSMEIRAEERRAGPLTVQGLTVHTSAINKGAMWLVTNGPVVVRENHFISSHAESCGLGLWGLETSDDEIRIEGNTFEGPCGVSVEGSAVARITMNVFKATNGIWGAVLPMANARVKVEGNDFTAYNSPAVTSVGNSQVEIADGQFENAGDVLFVAQGASRMQIKNSMLTARQANCVLAREQAQVTVSSVQFKGCGSVKYAAVYALAPARLDISNSTFFGDAQRSTYLASYVNAEPGATLNTKDILISAPPPMNIPTREQMLEYMVQAYAEANEFKLEGGNRIGRPHRIFGHIVERKELRLPRFEDCTPSGAFLRCAVRYEIWNVENDVNLFNLQKPTLEEELDGVFYVEWRNDRPYVQWWERMAQLWHQVRIERAEREAQVADQMDRDRRGEEAKLKEFTRGMESLRECC